MDSTAESMTKRVKAMIGVLNELHSQNLLEHHYYSMLVEVVYELRDAAERGKERICLPAGRM